MGKKGQISAFSALSAPLLAALLLAGCGKSGEVDLDAGLAGIQESNYKLAAQHLEKAVERLPDNTSAHANLGIAYWKLGRHKDAMSALRKAAQLMPEDIRLLELQAQVLMDMQNWTEARSILIQADKRQPSSPHVLTAIGLIDFRTGNNPQALAHFTQALEADPKYAPALYNMAVLQRDRLNNKDSASLYFQSYVKVCGNEARARDVPQFMGKAPQPLVTPPPPTPTPPPPKPVKPTQPLDPQKAIPLDPMVISARKAIEKQEFDIALELLKQATHKNTNDPTALWELATLYDRHLKYNEKAIDLYSKFVKTFHADPRAAAVQKRLGELHPTVAKPLQIQPPKPDPKPAAPVREPEAAQKAFEEGCKNQDEKKWNEAISNYKRALELDDTMALAAYNLGFAYKEKGDLNFARQAFAQALSIDPTMTKAGYMLAVVSYNLKDHKQAVNQLNKVLRVEPDYAKAHRLMGVILRDENNIEGAKQHFEKYIKLAPQEDAARTDKEWLDSLNAQPRR